MVGSSQRAAQQRVINTVTITGTNTGTNTDKNTDQNIDIANTNKRLEDGGLLSDWYTTSLVNFHQKTNEGSVYFYSAPLLPEYIRNNIK